MRDDVDTIFASVMPVPAIVDPMVAPSGKRARKRGNQTTKNASRGMASTSSGSDQETTETVDPLFTPPGSPPKQMRNCYVSIDSVCENFEGPMQALPDDARRW